MSKVSIYRLLANPFFYGAILWKGRVIEPEELPTENRHDPIVSKEPFDRVQEVLGLKTRPHGTKRFYTYSNLIKCGTCGGNISGMVGKGIVYYRCARCKGLQYIRENELEKQVQNQIAKITIDKDFYHLAMEEINRANEKEIENREAIRKQQQRELDRYQTRLDNLLRLKISPDNQDGELLSDEEFISQKKETLKEMRLIKEKMGDTDKQSQNWFDLCVEYVEFNKNLLPKFKKASPKKKREVFEFLYYNPTITAKILLTKAESPHKFIIEYNEQKGAIITEEFGLDKEKTGVLVPVCTVGRDIVNKVITFFKNLEEDYYIPSFENSGV